MNRINSPTAKSKPTFFEYPNPLDVSLDRSLTLLSFLLYSFKMSYDSSFPRSSMHIISISFRDWFKRLSKQLDIYFEFWKIGIMIEILVFLLKLLIE